MLLVLPKQKYCRPPKSVGNNRGQEVFGIGHQNRVAETQNHEAKKLEAKDGSGELVPENQDRQMD